jgi:hypothetical protein
LTPLIPLLNSIWVIPSRKQRHIFLILWKELHTSKDI